MLTIEDNEKNHEAPQEEKNTGKWSHKTWYKS
jgi:hypothetical protein